jgi:uncharacterized protein
MPELFFNRKRTADLPLHHGKVPMWLAERMALLGGAIIEAIILDYGRSAVLARLSDPFWFQSFGAVLGMDWHSSGITTSVMGALKRAINPKYHEFGIYIAGGKGLQSRKTPDELLRFGDRTGLNAELFVQSSKLSAKVDNTAIQDGFQLYQHSFVVSSEEEWAVIQQGLNDASGMARRYHWHSADLESFINEPHAFIYGINQGEILNLTASEAKVSREGILQIVKEDPGRMVPEIQRLILPLHHDVRAEDINLKRLGAMLALAHEKNIGDFESLLMLEGTGPRTLQSLALVSEIIHGTPTRFNDPARFSFAHGGKDRHPFPVPTKVYDDTIAVLKGSIEKAKIGDKDKTTAIRNLTLVAQSLENQFEPNEERFNEVIEAERRNSYQYGGRSIFGIEKPPYGKQLNLFDNNEETSK